MNLPYRKASGWSEMQSRPSQSVSIGFGTCARLTELEDRLLGWLDKAGIEPCCLNLTSASVGSPTPSARCPGTRGLDSPHNIKTYLFVPRDATSTIQIGYDLLYVNSSLPSFNNSHPHLPLHWSLCQQSRSVSGMPRNTGHCQGLPLERSCTS